MPFEGAAALSVAVSLEQQDQLEARSPGHSGRDLGESLNTEQGANSSQRELTSHLSHDMSDLHMGIEDEDDNRTWGQKLAIRAITTPAFDYVLGIIIFSNMVIMIIEIDASTQEGPSPSWTEVCGWIALTVFVLELLLRMFVYRCLFWKDAWNVFDFIVVVVDVSFSFIGLMLGDAFPVSILRIFRLAKLARVSKVLRIFPELRLLLAGLVGSVRAIVWGVVLLMFVVIVWAMVAVLFIHPAAETIDCEKCPFAYDSVFHASLTIWQEIIAGDSWGQVAVPVIKKYPTTILFFMPLFMTVGMAVMNLILGVVVNVALSAKDQISEEDSLEKKMFKMEQRTNLLKICHRMDVHKDGRLDRELFFQEFRKDEEFHEAITSMDLTEEDLLIMWSMLDHEKTGTLPYKVLMNKLYSARDSDTEFMLAHIKYHTTVIRNELLQKMTKMEAKMSRSMQRMGEGLDQEVDRLKETSGKPSKIKETKHCGMDGGEFAGVWQVLDEGKQPNSVQDTLKANTTQTGSFMPAGNSHETCEDNAVLQAKMHSMASRSPNCGKDLGNEFARDIIIFKTELQDILLDINQKLESQVSLVSLMNQKICVPSIEATAQGAAPMSGKLII